MSTPQNPSSPYNIVGVYNNPLGLDILKVIGEGNTIVYRFNQFQAIWYSGAGAPGTIRGVLSGNLYIDSLTGNIWRYNGSIWSQLSGGGSSLNIQNGEVVFIASTTGTLTYTPTSGFFLFMKNGQILLGGGVDYTLVGNTITLEIPALDTDIFAAWYSH